jgi:predicted dehydrogenase
MECRRVAPRCVADDARAHLCEGDMIVGDLGAVVVGTGFGVLTHLRALRAADFEVRALVGRDPEKTAARAEQFGVPHGLTSLGEALALPGVDAVAIATPPHTHCSLALEAIAAGKHVVCEKPFARNADEGRKMLEAAEAAGVVHLLGTEFRWATGQALATRAVKDGAIGDPRLATFVFHMPALANPAAEVPAWWGDADEGGGWLGAYGSHVIDQIRTTLGEFEGVSASLGLLSDRAWTADDTYTVHFRTRSGAEGILQSTAGAYGPFVSCSRIVGATGTLWIQGDDVFVADSHGQRQLEVPDDLRLPPPNPPPGELLVTAYDMLHSMGIDLAPYTQLFRVLRDRIRGEAVSADPAAATFEDGVAIQAVLDAVRLSSQERRWVQLPAKSAA